MDSRLSNLKWDSWALISCDTRVWFQQTCNAASLNWHFSTGTLLYNCCMFPKSRFKDTSGRMILTIIKRLLCLANFEHQILYKCYHKSFVNVDTVTITCLKSSNLDGKLRTIFWNKKYFLKLNWRSPDLRSEWKVPQKYNNVFKQNFF